MYSMAHISLAASRCVMQIEEINPYPYSQSAVLNCGDPSDIKRVVWTMERKREEQSRWTFCLPYDYAISSLDGVYFLWCANRIADRLDLEPVGVINLSSQLSVQGRPLFLTPLHLVNVVWPLSEALFVHALALCNCTQ